MAIRSPPNVFIFYGDNEGIRKTVPGFTGGYTYTTPNSAPPAIGVSAPNLVFSALPGSSPVQQSVNISNTGSGTLTYSVQSNASWLTATAGSGVAPDTLTVRANPGSLAPGAYSGTIQVLSSGAINNPQAIQVMFYVQGPTLAVSGNALSFAGFAGKLSNPDAQNVTISNVGAGSMNWTASSSVPWLQLNATSGTSVSGAPFTLSITPNIAGLNPGTDNGTVTVSSANAVSRVAADHQCNSLGHRHPDAGDVPGTDARRLGIFAAGQSGRVECRQ